MTSNDDGLTPIFDLSRDQLWSIVPALMGDQKPTDFAISIEHTVQDYYGGCGDKLIPTITSTMANGDQRRATIFAKRFSWKGQSEAIHYVHLAQQGIPAPRLLASFVNTENEEILLLEYLDAINIHTDRVEEWRQFFGLMARFNACPISEDYARLLPQAQFGPHLQHGGADEDLALCLELGRSGELGEELQSFSQRIELKILQDHARQLGAIVAGMPTCLVHQDFMPDNIGWRGNRQEMVVFDIHKNAIGPRFLDAARYLGKPNWQGLSAGLRKVEAAREDLTAHYLVEFARWGGPQVTLVEYRQEANLLAWASQVDAIHWMRDTGREEAADGNRERQAHCRCQLLMLLEYLGTAF